VDSESRLKTAAPGRGTAETAGRPTAMPGDTATTKRVKDPICGMTVDPSKAAATGNTFDYHGTTYYFCSRQHKQAFRNNPASSLSNRQGD
jgi:Cu+-exporting ATPase